MSERRDGLYGIMRAIATADRKCKICGKKTKDGELMCEGCKSKCKK